MRHSKLHAFFTLLFLLNEAIAQNSIPEFKPGDLPDVKITRTKYYDGSSLWGYIDGGADIYLEYGFEKVSAQEIEWQNYQFKIDIYQMKDAEAAFGIYSISKRKCAMIDSFNNFSCLNQFQFQIVKGRFYISIINDGGTSNEQSLSRRIGNIIVDKINGNNFAFPSLFLNPVIIRHQNNLKYIKSKLGIQNGFPRWEELFEGISNYSFYVLPIDTEECSTYIAEIIFSTEKNKNLFYKNLGFKVEKKIGYGQKTQSGITKSVKELSPRKIVYLESSLNTDDLTPYLKTIREQK